MKAGVFVQLWMEGGGYLVALTASYDMAIDRRHSGTGPCLNNKAPSHFGRVLYITDTTRDRLHSDLYFLCQHLTDKSIERDSCLLGKHRNGTMDLW